MSLNLLIGVVILSVFCVWFKRKWQNLERVEVRKKMSEISKDVALSKEVQAFAEQHDAYEKDIKNLNNFKKGKKYVR